MKDNRRFGGSLPASVKWLFVSVVVCGGIGSWLLCTTFGVKAALSAPASEAPGDRTPGAAFARVTGEGIGAVDSESPLTTTTTTPTRTSTPTPTFTPVAACNYDIVPTSGATIVPGITNVLVNCDDCSASVSLPFSYRLYDTTFTSVNVVSNGHLDFNTPDVSHNSPCLPVAGETYSIIADWRQLHILDNLPGCVQDPGGHCGVLTSVSGTAPNRIFNIEWRATTFDLTQPINFEIRLYEGQTRFDAIYGIMPGDAQGSAGVQRNTGSFTSWTCNGFLHAGLMLTYALNSCPTATSTDSPTITQTPTPTSTAPTSTSTNTGTITPTPTNTDTPTNTGTPTITATSTPSNTPIPGCAFAITPTSGATMVPGTSHLPLSCDDCFMSVALPFPYTLYDQTFTSANVVSNGHLDFGTPDTSHLAPCVPVASESYSIIADWQQLHITDSFPGCVQDPGGHCGVFTSTTGTAPNRVFNIEWRATTFDLTQAVNFEIRLFEGQNRFDTIYGVGPSSGGLGSAGVQRDTSNFTSWTCHGNFSNGLMLSYIGGTCFATPTNTPTRTITSTPTNTPTRTATRTFTPVASPTNYVITRGTATMVPGTLDIGNHCDDCVTAIRLPFAAILYDQGFSTAIVGSNGTLGFVANSNPSTNACVPTSALNWAILPYWDNLTTSTSGCSGCGIFTSISGATPNRVFNIEWRARRVGGLPVDFEIRLFEGSGRFDLIYGLIDQQATESVGVQRDTGSRFTQVECLRSGASGRDDPDGGITAGIWIKFDSSHSQPTATPTSCAMQFIDVPQGSTFYAYVRCLACRGVISGYADGTFRPNNNITRGQIAKIVSNAVGFDDDPGQQMFEDVPPGSTFYSFAQRLAVRSYMSGYPCGGPGEPCGPGYLPYFRPSGTATRGQVSKIVSNAASFSDQPGGQTYEDVPPNSTFYLWIERLGSRGIINGYPCGGPGEPCNPSYDPYFRPGASVTRGQTSKIVSNTFFPNCQTPVR